MESQDSGGPSDAVRPAEVRLSDADREIVIAQLREATDEGRITLLEFEERAGQAYGATFPSELIPLTADLPIRASELPSPKPVEVQADPIAKKTRWAVQIMGGNERRGNWCSDGQAKSITIMGGQVLDLTSVTAQAIDLTCYTLMGGTEIIVPDGAVVDFNGFILFGGTANETTPDGESEMVVRVRAFGAMGGCNVRNLKRRERKKRGLPPK